MNIAELAEFYTLAMGCDQRMRPLDDRQLQVWARLVDDVPYMEAGAILAHLYRVRRISILQPGDIVEAWQEIQQARRVEAAEAAPECPAHTGQKLPHCGACRSEILTGQRRRDQIGVRLPWAEVTA